MADTMKGLKRTHYCGTVTPEMIGREVVVCGWAQKTRDMGTLVFIDLRDRTGIVQLAFDDKTDPALLAKAQKVRAEYVLMARGVLRQRESVNHEIPTGEVEVYVTELRVLAESNTPPFAISDDSRGVKEDLRLKYRYLDLRRPEMQNAASSRSPAITTIPTASTRSRPPSSSSPPRRVPATTWYPAVCSRAGSMPCPSPPSCISRF